jgi:hypothetical protein
VVGRRLQRWVLAGRRWVEEAGFLARDGRRRRKQHSPVGRHGVEEVGAHEVKRRGVIPVGRAGARGVDLLGAQGGCHERGAWSECSRG